MAKWTHPIRRLNRGIEVSPGVYYSNGLRAQTLSGWTAIALIEFNARQPEGVSRIPQYFYY